MLKSKVKSAISIITLVLFCSACAVIGPVDTIERNKLIEAVIKTKIDSLLFSSAATFWPGVDGYDFPLKHLGNPWVGSTKSGDFILEENTVHFLHWDNEKFVLLWSFAYSNISEVRIARIGRNARLVFSLGNADEKLSISLLSESGKLISQDKTEQAYSILSSKIAK